MGATGILAATALTETTNARGIRGLLGCVQTGCAGLFHAGTVRPAPVVFCTGRN